MEKSAVSTFREDHSFEYLQASQDQALVKVISKNTEESEYSPHLKPTNEVVETNISSVIGESGEIKLANIKKSCEQSLKVSNFVIDRTVSLYRKSLTKFSYNSNSADLSPITLQKSNSKLKGVLKGSKSKLAEIIKLKN